jgi:hypothetical protein
MDIVALNVVLRVADVERLGRHPTLLRCRHQRSLLAGIFALAPLRSFHKLGVAKFTRSQQLLPLREEEFAGPLGQSRTPC